MKTSNRGRHEPGPDQRLIDARTTVSLSSVAARLEECLDTGARFDLTGLRAPLDPAYPPELDRVAMDLHLRAIDNPHDPEVVEAEHAKARGAAWLRSIQTGDRLAAEARASGAGAFSLESLLDHVRLDDLMPRRLAGGLPMPSSVLPRLGFREAVRVATDGRADDALVAALDARIADAAPDHPHRQLLRSLAAFLVLLARSQHDAGMAVAGAAGFLRRFRDVPTMRMLGEKAEQAAIEGRLERMISIRAMAMATLAVGSARVMLSVDDVSLNIIEMPRGRLAKHAPSVSIALRGMGPVADDPDPLAPFRRMLSR